MDSLSTQIQNPFGMTSDGAYNNNSLTNPLLTNPLLANSSLFKSKLSSSIAQVNPIAITDITTVTNLNVLANTQISSEDLLTGSTPITNPIEANINSSKDSAISAKISKDKKDKNKIKSAYVSDRLTRIFGDRETIRINSGGLETKDSLQRVWAADTNFIDGKKYSTILPIADTSDPNLFQSGRIGENFSYQMALPDGKYTVKLGFTETPYITGIGERVFDVIVEDEVRLNDLDIWSQVGSQKQLTKSIKVNLKDGFLDLEFNSLINEALVSYIEITPDKTRNNTQSTLVENNVNNVNQNVINNRNLTAITLQEPSLQAANENVTHDHINDTFINAGGPQYTDIENHLWSADKNFIGGATFSTTQNITGTTDPTLYKTERWGNFTYNIPVATAGTYQIELNFAEIYWNGAGLRVFDVKAEGQLLIDNLDIWSEVGVNAALTKLLEVGVSDGVLNLEFISVVNNAKISAIHIFPSLNQTSDPFLHVVARVPTYVVDYEGNGSEEIFLRGDESHTHEFNRELNSFIWKDGTNIIGSTANITSSLNLGQHQISLTIADNNPSPRTLVDPPQTLNVYSIDAVGGILTNYYLNSGIVLLPEVADFAQISPTLRIEEIDGKLGESSITGNVAVVMRGKFNVTTTATYDFSVNGESASNIYIDGNLVTAPISLTAGSHTLEARIARLASAVAPIEIFASINGGVATLFNPVNLAHSQDTLKPFVNSLSQTTGSTLGGQTITIKGLAFFDGDASNLVKVRWGNLILEEPYITVNQGEITFVTPSGNLGTVLVSVETPNGISEAVTYEYLGATVPVNFNPAIVVATPFAPTQADWGPDGRLYVASIDGKISIYTFDENYTVTNVQEVTTVSNLSNNNILGIAFNPFDPPGSTKIYVSHSQLFANNGGQFINPTDISIYSGQVSVLEGPNFSTLTPIITKLPVSNHDHGVNGLAFDNKGDLLIAVGSNTNAGIPANGLGGLPESPLAAAILKAKLSDPNFQGNLNYLETLTGNLNNNQVFGDKVDLAPGSGVTVFAAGLRNPFDVVWTTQDKAYSVVNGPNAGFGAKSTSATTQGADPTDVDELNLLVDGNYYGHPNRNRGRYDNRQNVYQGSSVATIPNVYTAPLAIFQSSTNGITEYRSAAFNGQAKGNLLAQKWNGPLNRIQLSADGTTVQSVTTIINGPTALDVVSGPAGAILGIDYTDNTITVSLPNIIGVTNATAYDIFPWRAPTAGGGKFVIGGQNFGDLSNTTVTIGGIQAVLTLVSPKRIEGFIPAQSSVSANMVDVVVNSNGITSTLANAFRYLTSVTPPVTPGTLAFSTPTYTVNENGTVVSAVTINRTGGSSGEVSVTLTPSNGTATASTDFNGAAQTITFANGETSKTVVIPIVNDTATESAETINLTLSNVIGGATIGIQNQAILSIVDNDRLAQILINTGGSQYTDIAGQVWLADQNFFGTSYTYAVTQPVTGTNDSLLYQNERSGVNKSPFSYQIPVTNGTYLVNLNFAELYWNAAGKRIFNVNVEGQQMLQNFDLWTQAGGKNKALTRFIEVIVTDGILNINFSSSVDSASVTSIELLKVANLPVTPGTLAFSTPTYIVNENGTAFSAVTINRTGGSSGEVSVTLTPSNGTATASTDFNGTAQTITFTNGETSKTVVIPIVNDTATESAETINLTLSNVIGGATIGIQNQAILSIVDNDRLEQILINTGGSQYTDIAGQVWLADQNFFGTSSTYAITQPVTGTSDPLLYQNERSGVNKSPFSYQIPVTNGTYLVNLNFAELYWNAAGKRIFNVNVEGQQMLQNFDLWTQAGGKNKALTKFTQVIVTDGILNINFSSTVDNASVTSIELLKIAEPATSGIFALSEPTILPAIDKLQN